MFSHGDPLSYLRALAAVGGVASYAFPLIAPWYIFILLVTAVLGFRASGIAAPSFVWGSCSALLLALVLLGDMPAPIATALSAASLLAICGMPLIGASILVLHLSVFSSIEQILSDLLTPVRFEAATPSLLAIAALLLVDLRRLILGVTACLVTLAAAWVSTHTLRSPEAALLFSAIPAGLFAFVLSLRPLPVSTSALSALPITALLCFGLTSWAWTLPRTWSEVYVLLPKESEAAEASFFRNYPQALQFAGIKARQVERPEDVSPGGLLILPWVTSPFSSDVDDPLTAKIGQLARERRWTIIVAGEHTNLGGAATRVATMAGRPILRNDLTVPRGNYDDSGPLHVSSFIEWPHESIFNRGASVQVGSLFDRVLLAGDGWWAEPDIGEWLWVGDYNWAPGDRAGRLALAVAADIGGARWVVVGDNSPLINSQIIADPRALNRLLRFATLWPAFIKDVVLFVLGILLLLPDRKWRWRPLVPIAGAATIGVVGTVYSLMIESAAWRDFYVGQSGFDERNFNVVLSEHPALIENRRVVRLKEPISGKVSLPQGDSIMFTLVDRRVTIGGVSLESCRRLGSISTTEGPYLMDAQVCRIQGPAQILIGTVEATAGFKIPHPDGEAIVLLDAAFLAQKAPGTNAAWLLKQIGR